MRRKVLAVLGFGLALGVACAQARGAARWAARAQRQGGGQAGAQGRAGAQAGQTVVAAGQQAVPVDPKKLRKIEGRTVNARTGELVPRQESREPGGGRAGRFRGGRQDPAPTESRSRAFPQAPTGSWPSGWAFCARDTEPERPGVPALR